MVFLGGQLLAVDGGRGVVGWTLCGLRFHVLVGGVGSCGGFSGMEVE